jgi:hypothetical protein
MPPPDAALLKRREEKKAHLKDAISRELAGISRRKANWSPSQLKQMDDLCLKSGKRCVMWSDEGAGWYVLINWVWEDNRPLMKAEGRGDGQDKDNNSYIPGYYEDLREILKPPLLDGSVPPERLAAWIDANTISVHHNLMTAMNINASK